MAWTLLNEFIHGDCMDYMKDMPDNAFELAIVDPPYGIGISKSREIGYKGFNQFTPKEWDNETPTRGRCNANRTAHH